jgi:hypothetical protein
MIYDIEVATSDPSQDPLDVLAEVLGDGDYSVVSDQIYPYEGDYRPNHWTEYFLIRISTPHTFSPDECEELCATPVTP